MVPPAGMCTKHLLGEHGEVHMIIRAMEKPQQLPSLIGLAAANCIDSASIVQRHDMLAWEMTRRGMMHHTDIISPVHIPSALINARVDWKRSVLALAARCPECRARMLVVLRANHSERGDDPPSTWSMPDL